jgi:hypothetical protein
MTIFRFLVFLIIFYTTFYSHYSFSVIMIYIDSHAIVTSNYCLIVTVLYYFMIDYFSVKNRYINRKIDMMILR